MSRSNTVNKILKGVLHLDNSDKLILMERLGQMLKNESIKPELSKKKLTALEGLGSEIWKDINIDHYINEQRQWD